MDKQEVLADMLGSEGQRMPQRVREGLATPSGAFSLEGNAYIIEVDESHERVHVHHESVPHLDAEMSTEEFFQWADMVGRD